MRTKTGIGIATGKIILIGEHAVVYGEPALAIPFLAAKIKTTVRTSSGPVQLKCIYHKGPLNTASDNILGLKKVIEEAVLGLGKELYALSIEINSNIPPERGMGSSAAVSAATIKAIYNYFGVNLSQEKLLELIHLSEKIAHGNPSGLDGAIASGIGPLYYIKGQPFVSFNAKLSAYLIVADSGVKGQTREAVNSVGELMKNEPLPTKTFIQDIGHLTEIAKVAIESNDPTTLGHCMTKAHNILNLLGVSNRVLNNLVNKAVESGALGAKLTGGGRGGCMIALAKTKEEAIMIADKLLTSGAVNTWISNMEEM